MRRYRSIKEVEYLGDKILKSQWPPAIGSFPLVYEVDPTIRETRPYFLQRTFEGVGTFIRTYCLEDHYVETKPHQGPNGCFILMRDRIHKPSLKDQAEQVRRSIALEIGLAPAAFQFYLPEFDPEFTLKWRYRYYVECRNHENKCVRPDHLILQRSINFEVKYPLMFRTHISV